MKISIVVPVYNEAANIAALLDEITAAMRAAEAYEIIYVDDGSDDLTATALAQALQDVNALRVIRHQRSCGQSTAIYTGVKAARYPLVATLDGDGQNDPADILRLCAVFMQQRQTQANLWMVAGWRNKRHDSAWRRFSSKVANTVRAALLGDNTPDSGCGLKVFLRDEFLALPYFDHMHRFLPALVLRAGGQVISEPVNHRSRTNGYSKYGTLDRLGVGITDLLGVIWLQKRAKLAEVKELEHR
ncbi:MAG: glycosyltransferase family 2 protein [Methylovulum sp.]|nr:glycosyltransferase family 2 protein [Methylovulum sp.]